MAQPVQLDLARPLGLYASKRDTRLLVPKATPMLGWTLDFGHPSWVYVVAAIAVLPLAFVLIRLAFG